MTPWPNFFILGAQKAGTTTLYTYLAQHPDVYMPSSKEPHFFDYYYEKGAEEYRQRHFGDWNGEKAIGEASPSYLSVGSARERIAEMVREPRLIIILRHPAERAYSEWWMTWSHGWEHLSFSEAIDANLREVKEHGLFEGQAGEKHWHRVLAGHLEGRIRYRSYLQHGYYSIYIRHCFELFPRRNIKILLFNDLVNAPRQVVADVCDFLGVDSRYPMEEPGIRNKPLTGPAVPLTRFLARFRVIRLFPLSLRLHVRNLLAGRGKRPKMTLPIRKRLNEHFAPYNRDLEELLSLELPDWYE